LESFRSRVVVVVVVVVAGNDDKNDEEIMIEYCSVDYLSQYEYFEFVDLFPTILKR